MRQHYELTGNWSKLGIEARFHLVIPECLSPWVQITDDEDLYKRKMWIVTIAWIENLDDDVAEYLNRRATPRLRRLDPLIYDLGQ